MNQGVIGMIIIKRCCGTATMDGPTTSLRPIGTLVTACCWHMEKREKNPNHFGVIQVAEKKYDIYSFLPSFCQKCKGPIFWLPFLWVIRCKTYFVPSSREDLAKSPEGISLKGKSCEPSKLPSFFGPVPAFFFQGGVCVFSFRSRISFICIVISSEYTGHSPLSSTFLWIDMHWNAREPSFLSLIFTTQWFWGDMFGVFGLLIGLGKPLCMLRQFLMAVAFVILFVTCSTIMKFVILEAETDWREACQAGLVHRESMGLSVVVVQWLKQGLVVLDPIRVKIMKFGRLATSSPTNNGISIEDCIDLCTLSCIDALS